VVGNYPRRYRYRSGRKMKSSRIFGRRKWFGLWFVVIAIMLYSIVAHLIDIDSDIAGKVVWGAITAYGAYVAGNMTSKFVGGDGPKG